MFTRGWRVLNHSHPPNEPTSELHEIAAQIQNVCQPETAPAADECHHRRTELLVKLRRTERMPGDGWFSDGQADVASPLASGRKPLVGGCNP